MRVIRRYYFIFVPMFLCGCVERYYPETDDLFTGTLVINASITNLPGIQTFQISRSDGLINPEFIPESGCLAEVENQEGDQISFTESEPGYYSCNVPESFMHFGDQYMLRVVTSGGRIYQSDYSGLNPSTAIHKISYEMETYPTSDPDETIDGIRFYIDFEVDADSSEFLLWELVETYEFHNPDYEGYIYSFDRKLKPIPDSLEDRQCWITEHVNDLYTLDVANMSAASYKHKALHFVSNETQRLSYGYSLLVRQHSLDAPAFRYWDELKKNSQGQSSIYNRLPSITPANIYNVDDPNERILGFFGVSGVTERRLFVREVEGLKKYDVLHCFPQSEPPRFRFLMTTDLPVYLSRANDPVSGYLVFGETELKCLDCRVRTGSSGDPPDFWPID